MRKKSTDVQRLCYICLDRPGDSSRLCGVCNKMDIAIHTLIQENPKQAFNYLDKKAKEASKAVRNRYMNKAVGS